MQTGIRIVSCYSISQQPIGRVFLVMEIERKFLVSSLPPGGFEFDDIVQTYVFSGTQGEEFRVRRKAALCYLTIKTDGTIAREEVELEITEADFNRLKAVASGGTVEKRRTKISYGGVVIELDVFGGKLRGLMLAEVEFADEAVAARFRPPSWFGREVTDDARYKNKNLAKAGSPPSPVAG